jgi:lysophospholipase L1-like esterase
VASPTDSAVSPSRRLFVLGDSISIQYGPYLKRALTGAFECNFKRGEEAHKDLNIPTGANGGDSGMCLSYLRSIAGTAEFAADFLLLNCGLHDIKTDLLSGARQVPIEQYRANLRAIIDVVRNAGVRMIWMRTTPVVDEIHNTRNRSFRRFAADVADYNAAADAIMNERGVPIIDLHTFTLNLGPDLFCDHVHYHEPIRQQQGAYLAGWISSFAAYNPA